MTLDNVNNAEAPLLGHDPHQIQFKPFGLFWNIVKAFAGAGTFALPWAIMNAGLWGGVVGVVLIALLSNYTIRTLLKCGDRVMEIKERQKISGTAVAPPSYPEIGRVAYGELGAKTVSFFSGCMCFGVCIAYFTLIGSNMEQLLCSRDPNLKDWEIIWIIFPLTVFLSCLTDMSKLAYTSIAGSAALLIAMGAVVINGLSNHLIRDDYSGFEWKTMPLFLGGAAFLFIDHVILVPLANTCGNYRKFPRVLDFAMIFVTVINVIFAAFCYVFYSSKTGSSVINNLPQESAVGDIVRIGISLEVLASFPLVAGAGFQSMETGFALLERVRAFPHSNPGERRHFFSRNLLFYLFRGGVIALLALMASAVKNFGLLVSLIGSLTIASTGFVLPQIFYLKLFSPRRGGADFIIQCVIIAFGIGITTLGTYQATDGLIDALKNPPNATTC